MMSENNVKVIALPPHTTHWSKPPDRSFFKSMKSSWNELANQEYRKDPLKALGRNNLMKIFEKVWQQCSTVQIAQNGFRACGIFSLNLDAIPNEAYDPSFLTERQLERSTENEPALSETIPSTSQQQSFLKANGTNSSSDSKEEILALRKRLQPELQAIVEEMASIPSVQQSTVSMRKEEKIIDLTSTEHIAAVRQKMEKSKKPMTSRNKNHY